MISVSDLKRPLNECIVFLDSYIDHLSNLNDSKSIEFILNNLREDVLDYMNENNEIKELRNI